MSLMTTGPADRTGAALGDRYISAGMRRSCVVYQNVDDPVLRDMLPAWEEELSFDAFDPALDPLATGMGTRDAGLTVVIDPEALLGKTFSWLSVDAEPDAELTAFAAVNHVATILRVPIIDVLKATGIKNRTFYSWRDSDVNPRVGSQGELWRLVSLCDDLEAVLGQDVREWFRADQRHRGELQNGQFEDLPERRLHVPGEQDPS